MITVIISHEVKSFDEWKPGFDSHSSLRDAHSLKMEAMYRGVENPNSVTLIFSCPGEDKLKAFMADPSLKEAMEKGGVISHPEVKILHKVH